MAGMFFTLDEVVEKLGKTKEQIQELIDAGNLREFWDGSKQLFKISDVDELADTLQSSADEANEWPDSEAGDGSAESPSAEEGAGSEETADIETLDVLMDDIETPLEAGGDIFAGEELVELAGEELKEVVSDDGLGALMGDEGDEIPEIVEAEPEPQEAAEEEEVVISAEDSLDLLAADETDAGLAAGEEVSAEEPASILPEDSIELIMPDETSVEAVESEVPAVEQEAVKPEDSIDFLLADETGLTPAVNAEEESLLSDETLSGLLGNDNEQEQEMVDDLGDLGEDVTLGELTSADTTIGTTGVNVLAESEGEFDLIGDSKSETQGPETEDFDLEIDSGGDSTGLGDLDLDADINLDSIGSGSGLLDLSLQADDTSLGAVLDDILPAGDDLAEMTPDSIEGESAVEESEKIFDEAESQMAIPAGSAPVLAARYIEPEPTGLDNAYGVTMLLPFVMLIFATIIVMLSLPSRNIKPAILTTISSHVAGIALVWWIGIGLIVLLLAVIGVASMAGASSGTGKTKKTKKTKKEKKPKKPKKPKKKKGKK
jgi:hypothetical protein